MDLGISSSQDKLKLISSERLTAPSASTASAMPVTDLVATATSHKPAPVAVVVVTVPEMAAPEVEMNVRRVT